MRGEGRIPFWELIERVRVNMHWKKNAIDLPRQQGSVVICGGGPSLEKDIKYIKQLVKKKCKLWTVNKTHDYLRTKALISDYCCLLDPKDWVADYVQKPNKKTTYLVSSQCDELVFKKLKSKNIYLWHAGVDYFNQEYPTPILAKEQTKPFRIIPGPTTVGLRSLLVAYDLGFRDFHLFGFDSSFAENGNAHAYDKPPPPDASLTTKTISTRLRSVTYQTNTHMAKQADDFEELIEKIGEFIRKGWWDNIDITVYGTGLLPSLAATYGLHGDPNMNKLWTH
tara:strand:+ start:1069 stop:1911 length:843 start_codon:yes stop_codon:yes gene_type:complete